MRAQELAATPTSAARLSLRATLLFAGFATPPSQRVLSLLRASARDSARDLDSASPGFESLVGNLREAAGFGDSPAWHAPRPELHPWASVLAGEVATIQAELRACVRDEPGRAWTGAEYAAIAPDWRFTHLWQDGRWLPEGEERYPATVALLKRLEASHQLRLNPLQNVACGFARQPAGSGISPHCDGNLLGLTAHLALMVPADGCWIEVGGERRSWSDGRLLLMDTTHTHHTHNGGASDRYILMLNVVRPEVADEEVAALRHYMHAPPLRLDALNPGWLRVPSFASKAESGTAELGDELGDGAVAAVLTCAPSREEADERVLLDSRAGWEAARGRGGSAGLVRFEPLDGLRAFRVTELGAGVQPRTWPTSDAAATEQLPTLEAGEVVLACAAAIDDEGSLEWLAVPIGEGREWLVPAATSSDDLSGTTAPAAAAPANDDALPLATLQAHLELLRMPDRQLAWVPVWTEDDERLLVEE